MRIAAKRGTIVRRVPDNDGDRGKRAIFGPHLCSSWMGNEAVRLGDQRFEKPSNGESLWESLWNCSGITV